MMEYNNPNDPWLNQGYDPYKGMSDEERVKTGCFQLIGIVFGLIGALLVCLLFGSCTTTKYVPVIEHKTDTLIVTKHQHDSIHVHDSIMVSEKGDTVRIEKWHTRYVEKQVHDTTYISKTDSIPVPYPVTEYVKKPLSTTEKVLMGIGLLALMGLIVWGAYKLRRFLPWW